MNTFFKDHNFAHNYTLQTIKLPLIQRASKQFRTAKTSFYPELEDFRRLSGHQHSKYEIPFTSLKKYVWFYKSVFFSLSLLFLVLGLVVFMMYSNSHSIMNIHFVLKNTVCVVCGFFATAAFFMGAAVKTDKEIICYYVRKAHGCLKTLHRHNRVKLGFKRFLFFGENYRMISEMRNHYLDAHEKIHESKQEAFHLLERIKNCPQTDKKSKEKLFNQAIAELNNSLQSIIHSFNKQAR